MNTTRANTRRCVFVFLEYSVTRTLQKEKVVKKKEKKERKEQEQEKETKSPGVFELDTGVGRGIKSLYIEISLHNRSLLMSVLSFMPLEASWVKELEKGI